VLLVTPASDPRAREGKEAPSSGLPPRASGRVTPGIAKAPAANSEQNTQNPVWLPAVAATIVLPSFLDQPWRPTMVSLEEEQKLCEPSAWFAAPS